MDQDHSLVKKLNISIDLVVYNTIIIDEIRVLNTNIETIKTKIFTRRGGKRYSFGLIIYE